MNNILSQILKESTVRVNKNVVEGPVKEILKTAPEYLDEIISTTVNTMGHTGLTYHGWRRLSPKEEFNRLFTTVDKKTNYDLARSDLYLIELRFEFKGKAIPKFIYLPYADRGNLIKISDTYYNIVPVLSDTVISPSNKEVFVRLLKDKLTFSRYNRNFILDNERIAGQVIYSNIYRLAGRKIEDNLGTAYPSASLYLLGMFGLKDTLAKYAGVTKFMLTTDDANDYREAYHVYESTKIKPRGNKEKFYNGHDVKILIAKEEVNMVNKPFLDNFIFGIIYVLDIMPDHANDLIELVSVHDVPNEIMFWRILLGRIIFKNGYSIDKIILEMTDHFNTLLNYMDNHNKQKLKEVGIQVDTFFDLLSVILGNFNKWLLNSKEYNSDIANRYVDVLYYILYDIIYGINRTLFDINKKANKKDLSDREIISIFNNFLTSKKIFSIIKSSSPNMTMALSDSSGDSQYFKITSQFKDRMVCSI